MSREGEPRALAAIPLKGRALDVRVGDVFAYGASSCVVVDIDRSAESEGGAVIVHLRESSNGRRTRVGEGRLLELYDRRCEAAARRARRELNRILKSEQKKRAT